MGSELKSGLYYVQEYTCEEGHEFNNPSHFVRKSHCFDVHTPVARQISSFGFVARQPNQLTGILKSPYESNAYFMNFIHQPEVYFACCYGHMDFTSLLGNSI